MFRYHATSSFPIQATELQPGFQAIQATELRMSLNLTFPLLRQRLLSSNETFLQFVNHKNSTVELDVYESKIVRRGWDSNPRVQSTLD